MKFPGAVGDYHFKRKIRIRRCVGNNAGDFQVQHVIKAERFPNCVFPVAEVFDGAALIDHDHVRIFQGIRPAGQPMGIYNLKELRLKEHYPQVFDKFLIIGRVARPCRHRNLATITELHA